MKRRRRPHLRPSPSLHLLRRRLRSSRGGARRGAARVGLSEFFISRPVYKAHQVSSHNEMDDMASVRINQALGAFMTRLCNVSGVECDRSITFPEASITFPMGSFPSETFRVTLSGEMYVNIHASVDGVECTMPDGFVSFRYPSDGGPVLSLVQFGTRMTEDFRTCRDYQADVDSLLRHHGFRF
jgi:hypothetical protein